LAAQNLSYGTAPQHFDQDGPLVIVEFTTLKSGIGGDGDVQICVEVDGSRGYGRGAGFGPFLWNW
jgi:hypothetical protein